MSTAAMAPAGLPTYQSPMFIPHYQAFTGERWSLRHADMVLCPGYWTPPQLVNGMALLMRADETGKMRTWMSMSPMEIESQEIGCQHASGHVLVMGLGMGWAAANAALHPDVSQVTVVEFDPEVIAAVTQSGIFSQLPAQASQRVRVLQGDAHQYVPDMPVDTLLADIWLPLFGAERDAEVRRMRDNTGAKRVYFWGQEMLIAQRARQAGLALTADVLATLIAQMDLPLIGPAECPDYLQRIQVAAGRWLKAA